MKYPHSAPFAFTILDDTDDTTVENGRPVYALLRDLGFRTTKTVWALDTPRAEQGPFFAGETLQRPAYLEWVRKLASDGFEIAFHNASMGSSARCKTVAALDLLERELAGPATVHCNHGQNRENLYWGSARYSTLPIAGAYALLAGLTKQPIMDGHVPDSDFFWGDVAHRRLKYVRAFAFGRLDCSTIPPRRPFGDPRKPYVQTWFNTADAPNVTAFKRLVTPAAVDRLAERGGWAIVSTHLGKGFVTDGRPDPAVTEILRHIASMRGWLVPVGELLDHLCGTVGRAPLRRAERWRMEYGHLIDRGRAWLRGDWSYR